MCLSIVGVEEIRKRILGLIGLVLFVALSVFVFCTDTLNGWISFGLGILACASIVALVIGCTAGNIQNKFMGFLAAYTMPIFVMHTLFAAPVRTVLLKVGIQNAAIHVALGIVISFIGPMIAAWIMKKSKWLEFFLYPGKFVKII